LFLFATPLPIVLDHRRRRRFRLKLFPVKEMGSPPLPVPML
jgi:hypothetical protein